MRIVDRRQRIAITDAPERVSVIDRPQRILIGPEPDGVAPEPPPDVFYGIEGGLARYDARTLGLAEGAPVSTWGDASEQVADAVQDVAGRMPTYSEAVPGVLLGPPGGETHLRLPAELAFDELAPFTIVTLVDKTIDNPVTGQLVGYGEVEGGGQPWGLYQISAGRVSWIAGGNQRISAGGAWPVGLGIVDYSHDGSLAVAHLDGAQMAAPIAIGNVPSQAVVPALGAALSASGVARRGFAGIVHDILFFDRALSPAELATVRAGLATDWSL